MTFNCLRTYFSIEHMLIIIVSVMSDEGHGVPSALFMDFVRGDLRS